MLTVSTPDQNEARANATFDALMWALARPGEARRMPEPGLAAIATTLVDLECAVFAEEAGLRQVVAETGARLVDVPAEADHVFLQTASVKPLGEVACGSALYPDDGATVVIAASHAGGPRLRLTGPGIEGEAAITVVLPEAVWRVRRERCSYPEGFDLFIVDGRDVIGIPRSTSVEVL